MFFRIPINQLAPFFFPPRAALNSLAKMFERGFRNIELLVLRPAEMTFRLPHRFRAGRIAVRLARAGGRHSITDDGFDGDQRRLRADALRFANCRVDRVEIISIRNGERVPAVTLETLW